MFVGLAGVIIFTYSAFAQQPPSSIPAPIPVPTTTVTGTIQPAPVTIPMPPTTSSAVPGNVNKKLNLEDITVKGELLSDDRMNFVRRQREELKNRIKFRTNFRPEILQEYKN